jgi:glycerol-3-phosphate dehydrogenase (NAD(P)+)
MPDAVAARTTHLRVSVLGGGSWGTTIASLLSRNTPTLLWARDAQVVAEVNQRHTNERYLPDARLSQKLTATTDFEHAIREADLLFVATPAQTFRALLTGVSQFIRPWVPVISLAKGLEVESLKRMTEIVDELLPGHPPGVLTGPNLASEIISGHAAASVIAMDDDTIVRTVQRLFGSSVFRVYTNTDVVGCELGGALKNVIAIAAGMSDGFNAGDNTRAAIITRGLAELTRLGIALGGRAETFAGLAGMGDLVATCTSKHSRNRYVGEQLGKGRLLDEVIREMRHVAEGVKSVPAVVALARQHQVEMPIMQEVYKVVCEAASPRQALRSVLRIESGAEWEPG